VETDLVTLAAQDFAREPVARIQLPVRVPVGFHGSWIADRLGLSRRPDSKETALLPF
jgi:hypothetical protein